MHKLFLLICECLFYIDNMGFLVIKEIAMKKAIIQTLEQLTTKIDLRSYGMDNNFLCNENSDQMINNIVVAILKPSETMHL